jgi:hypothetical protein
MALAATISTTALFGQSSQNEPARQEIAETYRSKLGEGGRFIPGVRQERWRIKDIRGWSLRVERLNESRRSDLCSTRHFAQTS